MGKPEDLDANSIGEWPKSKIMLGLGADVNQTV